MQLLQFPFLVLQCIAEHLELYEVFTLATVSNKLKMNMKNWICRRRFVVTYNSAGTFRIGRKISNKLSVDTFRVYLFDHSDQPLVYNYESWTMLDRNSVSVRITGRSNSLVGISTFWLDLWDNIEIYNKMLEFISQVFPKSTFTLLCQTDDVDLARSALESVKKLQLELDRVTVRTVEEAEQDETYDEFAKLVLDECPNADTLHIECKISDNFVYNFETPIKSRRCIVGFAHWVTKEDVINYFLGCDEFALENVRFTHQQLSEIVLEWAKNPKTNVIPFHGPHNVDVYLTSLLTDVVQPFPDAIAVQKAKIRWEHEHKIVRFKEGWAYAIKAHDGTDALVYKLGNGCTLSKIFNISKEIDEMETEEEESDEEEVEDEEVDEDEGEENAEDEEEEEIDDEQIEEPGEEEDESTNED